MNAKKIAIYAGIFLAGVILSGNVRKIPLISQLPRL